MNKEIRELLEKLQSFTNTAVSKISEGDTLSAAFYFNLAASINSEIANKLVK